MASNGGRKTICCRRSSLASRPQRSEHRSFILAKFGTLKSRELEIFTEEVILISFQNPMYHLKYSVPTAKEGK
jgi:hypothetical protein